MSALVVITQAEAADAPEIARLSGQLSHPSSSADIEKRLSNLFDQDESMVFVARDSDKVLGWIHVQLVHRVQTDAFWEITGMVVEAAQRRNGIGKMLVEHAKDNCSSTIAKKIRVRTNVNRRESEEFYTSLGFDANKTQSVLEHER